MDDSPFARSSMLHIRAVHNSVRPAIRYERMALITALMALALAIATATLLAYIGNARSYVDNGDGYYPYAAQRVAQGALLYRNVLGTQPPLVYALGAAIFKVGGTLETLRLASGLMRLLCTLLVFAVGRRLFRNEVTAALGALIYALLPIGLTWDRSFDVNPPLTLLALLSLWPFVAFTPRALRLAGALAALALFTKNLYAPLLLASLGYLALRRRALLAPYLLGLLATMVALALALYAYAGPTALHDAFLGQEASPLNPDWFIAALAYVIGNDGGIALVAVIGAALCWRHARLAHASVGFAPWLLGGSCAVLLATLKEGTAGPVFQLAEPAIALLAAYGAVVALQGNARLPGLPQRAVRLALPALLALSLLSTTGGDTAVLRQSNAAEVERIAALVRAHAPAGATIIAPPYYALLTNTRLPGDAADTYIVAQRLSRGDLWALRWMRRVTADLRARRIPIVLIDLRLAAMAPLMASLRTGYHQIDGDMLPPALHVTVWLPVPR